MKFLSIAYRDVLPLTEIPKLPMEDFRVEIIESVGAGARLASLSVKDFSDGKLFLFAVLEHRDAKSFSVGFSEIYNKSFNSLTPECEQAHLFEREIAEQWCVNPIGHPWLKPVRFQSPIISQKGADTKTPVCGKTNFFKVESDEIHEVAVGPVHAGVIEPGHFRFQCLGESVHHLEISLGYQHRGVERALVGGPNKNTIHYMETLSGDTSIGHALAYCQAIESLSKTHVSARSDAIRGIALELERVANHIGDLGALAGDVGFLPTHSYCGRIRGDVLNMTADLCGNRFGRGLVRFGGVGFDIDMDIANLLISKLDNVTRDVTSAVNLLWKTPSVMARFEGTGSLSLDVCKSLGMVGVAARACGLPCDVRKDFPCGVYSLNSLPISIGTTGDVLARASVRWQEVLQSLNFIRNQLESLPSGSIESLTNSLQPNAVTISVVEGWRGEICHIAFTDEDGKIARWKIIDPSFFNWTGLAYALRGQEISDFPLCNKSFNLSYCGHDL